MDYLTLRNTLIKNAAARNQPIFGEFELTSRCNLSCEMCYLISQSNDPDLSTEAWKKIFDQAVDAGLLFALLTGGEIFRRKDFVELYTYLYDQGINITLFTNATLLSKEHLELFKMRPPEFIIITLYGYNSESYQKITKSEHAFSQTDQAIDQLIKHRLPLQLRTLAVNHIYQNLDAMIEYAQSKKQTLHYSTYIAPTRNQCSYPLTMRLKPKELVDFEKRLQSAFPKTTKNTITQNTKKSTCLALKATYFITYKGEMQACALAYTPRKNTIGKALKPVFDSLRHSIDLLEKESKCHDCRLLMSCQQCFAKRLLEGNSKTCSEYLKEHASLKSRTAYE